MLYYMICKLLKACWIDTEYSYDIKYFKNVHKLKMRKDIYNDMIKCIIVISLISPFNFFEPMCLDHVKI